MIINYYYPDEDDKNTQYCCGISFKVGKDVLQFFMHHLFNIECNDAILIM